MRPFITLLIFDERYRKAQFRCAFLMYFAVLVLGSIPGARSEAGELASGLVLHVVTYSLITLLLFSGANGSVWQKACKSFLIVVAMGAIDEFVQSFFPYRSARVLDWLVDINTGFFMSALLSFIWPTSNRHDAERG